VSFVRVADNPPKGRVALPRTPFGANLKGDYTPGWIASCRRATGFTPVNSLKDIRKLVEHSALVLPDNLLFHRLPSWSDKGGRKL
jgi:hypothetical protein